MRIVRACTLLAVAAVVALTGSPAALADEGGPMPDSVTLRGSVVLAEPAELPAGALLTVTVEDTARADAPAVPLATTQIELTGQQAPVGFSLSYPTAALDPRGRYSARARVTLGDRLLFTTTENNGVDAPDPAPIDLVLSQVQSPAVPDVSLTDTYWKLTGVNGAPVQVEAQTREPSLVFNGAEGRFSGSGGVNRLMGGYTLDGASLTFGQSASTMMAGPPEAMAQEQAILAALQQVRGFRITGDQLSLLDDNGVPVLTAVAVALT